MTSGGGPDDDRDGRDTAVEPMQTASRALGLVAAVLSGAAFGTSGPFAKALLTTGWSSPAPWCWPRIAALPSCCPVRAVACRGRWPVSGPTAGSSSSASSPSPGARSPTSTRWRGSPSASPCCWSTPGTVLVVLWVWLRTRRGPHRLTLVGVVVALAGLALVLDIAGQTPPTSSA